MFIDIKSIFIDMVIILNEKIIINHDNNKKLSQVAVSGEIRFTPQELYQMTTNGKRLFKLKCELWGKDIVTNDKLFIFNPLKYFPAISPTISEKFTFSEILGEGVLDEDLGKEEVYARFILTNLASGNQIIDKTETVSYK